MSDNFGSSMLGASAMSEDPNLSDIQFRNFFAELIKAQKNFEEAPSSELTRVASAISKNLIQLIELQTMEARRAGSASSAGTEMHARYLKAALADEVMLHIQGHSRMEWHQVLLEAALFRSSVAGDKVFDAIDDLLRVREPGQRDLARLYLNALCLGFMGRYRGVEAHEPLQRYKNDLFQWVYQRPAQLLGPEKRLTAQAYANTLSHLPLKRIARLTRWKVLFAIGFVSLLLISEVLWIWQSTPLRKSLANVALTWPSHDFLPVAVGHVDKEGVC